MDNFCLGAMFERSGYKALPSPRSNFLKRIYKKIFEIMSWAVAFHVYINVKYIRSACDNSLFFLSSYWRFYIISLQCIDANAKYNLTQNIFSDNIGLIKTTISKEAIPFKPMVQGMEVTLHQINFKNLIPTSLLRVYLLSFLGWY